MKCPKCQTDNPEGAKFCNECAYDLRTEARTLSKRFAHLQSHTPKFLVDKILAHKSVIEGERKLVTVFFADVASFTSFSEKLDPEQVYRIMDGAFRIMMDEIHEYEGTINQFTGDGVLALFGAPVAHEDHAQRACHAALAIQEAMVEYSERVKRDIGINFKMRAGLNTGPVVVGFIGDDLRMDYTAIGDTVNLASRMESNARPGTILVSNNTYKRANKQFQFASLGKVKVKGKEVPLDVYELVDKIEKPKSGLDRQIFSEMVGREKDLNRLEIQVLKAVNGEGSVVNIIGEAGIGKSRLVAELKNREIMKQVTLLEGRAISMGRNLSFHPVIDLLKQWARIREDDSEIAALSKLETAIQQVYPEEMQEVLPFVATLMGMKLSGRYEKRIKGVEGEALEKLIHKNVRELLIKATELRPLVIVIEDLHWADMSSIELMESLLRLAETQRILFVSVFRPSHKETGDRIVETLKEKLPVYYVEIVLQPLDGQMSETLINNMLNIRGFQHAVIDKIIERASGNPFFIEEVVRSFIDAGAVVTKEGMFKVTEKIDKMVIPHTINDVLMARIDRLEENTRNLVKVASVIGRSFFYRILTEVARTIEDIDSRLLYLKEIQLIRERKRMEEIEYLFKNALAQEAAYESILLQKRKEIHLNVADSIEKVFRERLYKFYGILSYHYSNGEDLDKAEEYMLKAGEEALKSSASNEALHYYQRAMELYIKKCGDAVDPNKIAELEQNIGITFLNKGQFVEAVDYFDRSCGSRGEKVQKNRIFLFIKLIINLLIIIRNLYLPPVRKKKIPNNLDNQIMNRTLSIGKAVGHVDIQRAFIDNIQATKQCFKFDISKSQIYFDIIAGSSCLFSASGISFNISRKLLDYARQSILGKDAKITFQFYKYCESLHNLLTGNWDEEYDEDLISYALKIGDIISVSGYLIVLGKMKLELGDFENSKKIINKLNTIADEFRYDHAKLDFYSLTSRLLMKKQEPYNALKYANDGIALADKTDWEPRKIQFLGIKSSIQIMQDDIDNAEKTIGEAEKLVFKVGKNRIVNIFYIDYLMGMFSYNLIRLESAICANDKENTLKYKKATKKNGKIAALYSRKQVAFYRTEAFRFMGRYYWLNNKQEKAMKWWDKSIKEGEHLRAKLELSKTYFEIGKRLLEKKSRHKKLNGILAEEYLEKARAMFEEMDLQWDLEQLDRIASDS